MSQLYPKGKKKLLDADIDLLVDDIKMLLIDTADEAYNAADEFHSDIASAGIVHTFGVLLSKTTVSGVFDAADIAATVSGDSVEAVVLYKDTGVSATSPLIAWFDVTTFTPTGVSTTIVMHASGLFSI